MGTYWKEGIIMGVFIIVASGIGLVKGKGIVTLVCTFGIIFGVSMIVAYSPSGSIA